MTPPRLQLLDGVRWDGEPVPSERGRALLAALAESAPGARSVGALVEAVWPHAPPEHPDKALQVQVSRLRARTTAGLVERTEGGYRLGLDADATDAVRLRRLTRTAREGWAAGDLEVVRHAASQAREVPIVGDEGDGALADLLARSRADRTEAGLLLGRVHLARGEYDQALPLLEELASARPDDESILADLLQAEADVRGVPAALTRYAAYDERVRDQLGADPGEGLRRVHAELLARDAPVREGLRYDASPMVGRDEDLAAVRGLLSRSRVVTIVGPGGLGKTRMAHLLGRLAPQSAVHVAELVGVREPDGVLPEVAAALGVRESLVGRERVRDTDLRRRVAERIATGSTLVILDNCEQVIDAVADLVAFLVAGSDRATFLLTSRSPLGIAAEEVYQLPQLGTDQAVELFLRRARAARPNVRLDHDEVCALVARLDGLPLAIELAAAKVRVMSVADITRRLADRFALLVGTDRSAPDRHRTLEAVIAWSWNLLREDDQLTMRRLAVFPDGFSLAGAEAVLGRDPLSTLAELVDQSLLVVEESSHGIRYRFLETVREFGLDRLAEAGASQEAQQALESWAVELGRTLASRLYTPDQIEVLEAARPELGNLAAVLWAALDRGDVGIVVPVLGLIGDIWTIHGDHLTLLGLTRRALEVIKADPPLDRPEELGRVLVQLLTNVLIFLQAADDEAIDMLRGLRLEPGTRAAAGARMMTELGGASTVGDAHDALAALCVDPDPMVARLACQWRAQAAENIGELDQALASAERALSLADGSDGPWTRAMICSQLAGLAMQEGDYTRARGLAQVAQEGMARVGAQEDVAQMRSLIAMADVAQGDVARARSVFEQLSIDDLEVFNMGWNVTRIGLAEVALAEGDVEEGLHQYRRALTGTPPEIDDLFPLPPELAPWTVFAEAAHVFAAVSHGRRDRVVDLAEGLRSKVDELGASQRLTIDFPVLGCVLVAVGGYDLTGEPDEAGRERAVRALALGYRFGYQRMLPSMAWDKVVALAEERAPGLLDGFVAEYSAKPSVDLGDQAVGLLTGRGSA